MNIWNIFLRRKKIPGNRRRHPRVQDRNLVRYLPSGNTSSEYLANLINLSESGVQFISAFILRPGTALSMVINLGQEGHQIAASARVVWAKKIPHTEACRAGAEFTAISEEGRLLIRHFVERCLNAAAA